MQKYIENETDKAKSDHKLRRRNILYLSIINQGIFEKNLLTVQIESKRLVINFSLNYEQKQIESKHAQSQL